MKLGLGVLLAAFASGCTYDFSNPPDRLDTTCVGAEAGEPCDDSSACTSDDACDGAGRCRGTAKLCLTPPGAECVEDDSVYRTYAAVGECRASDGGCDYAATDTPCASCETSCLTPCLAVECPALEGGCLVGSCAPGPPASCAYGPAAEDNACDAGGDDGLCRSGKCRKACTGPEGCDDTNPCTTDTCNGGVCQNSFNTADCGTCGICNGAGVCVYDASQDADCGDEPTCGQCSSLGTCALADFGTGCGTCMECDGGGNCDIPAPPDLPGSNCTTAAALCSDSDVCDGLGACLPRHTTAGTDCDDCMACDGQGACLQPVANGTPGIGCNAGATSCSAADVCDGSGGCTIGDFLADADCGTCGACDGAGTCLYDDTQDEDCGTTTTCGTCSGLGTCSYASSSVSCGVCGRCNGGGVCTYNAAADADCGNPCQECTSLGNCGAVPANQQGLCATCYQCNSGGSCVPRTNDTQGPGCNTNCRKCSGGTCVGHEWTCPIVSECIGPILCTETACEASTGGCCPTDCN